jgi:hypothetical protein
VGYATKHAKHAIEDAFRSRRFFDDMNDEHASRIIYEYLCSLIVICRSDEEITRQKLI